MKLLQTKWYWLWISFITGASSMGLEISAARLLAPRYGTSTIVWSSIIGIVLLALSAGYYVGGKLAERRLEATLLLRIILVGGIFIVSVPLLSKPLLGGLAQGIGFSENITLYLAAGSIISSLLLFGAPVFLLGCVSPYLLSLLTERFGHVGTTAGQLFALSTLGGLTGTFLPTLVLVPLMGTTNTIFSIAGILILTSLPGIPTPSKRMGVLVLAGLFAFGSSSVTHTTSRYILAQTESPYQYIKIASNGEQRFMQFDAGFGYQSVYDPHNLLTGYYFDYVSTLPSLMEPPADNAKLSILIIGLAGGTLARQLHTFYGDAIDISAVEIDAKSTKLAQEYMGLGDIPVRMHYQDGRPFLAASTDTYDLIVVDAYHNELQIPWTMTTKEFWEQIQTHLTPTGIAAMNLVALGAEKSNLVRAITNTQTQAFSYVYDIPLRFGTNANHLVLLTNTALNLAPTSRTPLSISPLARFMSEHATQVSADANTITLTDDHAPIEWLMAQDTM